TYASMYGHVFCVGGSTVSIALTPAALMRAIVGTTACASSVITAITSGFRAMRDDTCASWPAAVPFAKRMITFAGAVLLFPRTESLLPYASSHADACPQIDTAMTGLPAPAAALVAGWPPTASAGVSVEATSAVLHRSSNVPHR